MLEDLFKVVKSRLDYDDKLPNNVKSKMPGDLLFKCPRCQNVMFMDEYKAGLKVCSACSYHARISAKERLDLTVDQGSFVESVSYTHLDVYKRQAYQRKKQTVLENRNQRSALFWQKPH